MACTSAASGQVGRDAPQAQPSPRHASIDPCAPAFPDSSPPSCSHSPWASGPRRPRTPRHRLDCPMRVILSTRLKPCPQTCWRAAAWPSACRTRAWPTFRSPCAMGGRVPGGPAPETANVPLRCRPAAGPPRRQTARPQHAFNRPRRHRLGWHGQGDTAVAALPCGWSRAVVALAWWFGKCWASPVRPLARRNQSENPFRSLVQQLVQGWSVLGGVLVALDLLAQPRLARLWFGRRDRPPPGFASRTSRENSPACCSILRSVAPASCCASTILTKQGAA